MPRPLIFASASAVEEAFYSALSHADVAGVMALWADDEEVFCVHPGGPRLAGLHAVRLSFERLLADGPLLIRIRDRQVFESATLAVHSLVEQVSMSSSHGTRVVDVFTTNVYIKTAAGWQLLVHHASPGAEAERTFHETPRGRLH